MKVHCKSALWLNTSAKIWITVNVFHKLFLDFDIYRRDTYNAHQNYNFLRAVIGPFVIPHFTAAKASVRMGVFREIEYITKMPVVQI